MERILISLVGKEVIPNYRIYKEIHPTLLVLIATVEMTAQYTIQKELAEECNVKVVIKTVDGFNYQDCLTKIKELQINETDELYCNITGGTKLMAIALYDFFKESAVLKKELFYLDTNQVLSYLNSEKEPYKIKAEISLEEFIRLSGQKIKSFKSYSDQLVLFEFAIQKLNLIINNKVYLTQFEVFLDKIVKAIRGLKEKNKNKSVFELYKNSELINNNSIFDWDESKAVLFNKDSSVLIELELSIEQIDFLLFNAGWFELLTAFKIAKKTPIESIYTSVVFPALVNIERDKNEVDILINDGGKLIFIECKSGKVETKDIDRIKVRKDTYGGLISKSILVIRYKQDRLIEEKCKESNIEIVLFKEIERYNLKS